MQTLPRTESMQPPTSSAFRGMKKKMKRKASPTPSATRKCNDSVNSSDKKMKAQANSPRFFRHHSPT